MKPSYSIKRLCGVAVVFQLAIMLLLSCSNGATPDIAKKTPKRNTLPHLTSKNVTTTISDSGITRFRITTPEWLVFDSIAKPYWFFPKGILFERFNTKYHIEAKMKSDQATYHQSKSLWEFNGNVHVKNLQGEIFETTQLFWDNANNKFYSDKKIKIVQKTRIITGIGFESNASLTRYIIKNPQGIIPVE
ncbi:MAG: LPS export ABC transporter periplasmic protein LptC [Paludibacteraceae bacterium]|nr:LPS export ABC transporter periplasmic protein LptC [Paludibacteraceae bacterium]